MGVNRSMHIWITTTAKTKDGGKSDIPLVAYLAMSSFELNTLIL